MTDKAPNEYFSTIAMDYLEFHCSECRCGLRIRAEHRDKTIRCPNCQALQRYYPPATSFPGASSPGMTGSAGSSGHRAGGPLGSGTSPASELDRGTWSLRTPAGRVLTGLSRSAFEQEIRTQQLGAGTWFQGGDFSDWTPLERLFQSQVPGRGQVAGGLWLGPVASAAQAPLTGWPAAASPHVTSSATGSPGYPSYSPPQYPPHPYSPQTAGSTRYGALPLEAQLPAPRSKLVLVLGILGLCLPCTFVFSLAGLYIGVGDTLRIGNGNMSTNGSNTLTIGLVLCVLGMFLSGCCTVSVLSR